MTILQESVINKAKKFIANNKGKLAAAAGLAALAGGAYAAHHYDIGNIDEKMKNMFDHNKTPDTSTTGTPKVDHKDTTSTTSTSKVDHKDTTSTTSTPKVDHKDTTSTTSTPKIKVAKYTMKNKLAALDKHHDDINASTNVPDQSEAVDSGYNAKDTAASKPVVKHDSSVLNDVSKTAKTFFNKAKDSLMSINDLKPVKHKDNPDAGEWGVKAQPEHKSVFSASKKTTTPVMGNTNKIPTWDEYMKNQDIKNAPDYDMNDW